MKNPYKNLITDDELIEFLIMLETSGQMMDAAREFSFKLYPKFQLTTLESVNILNELQRQFNNNTK